MLANAKLRPRPDSQPLTDGRLTGDGRWTTLNYRAPTQAAEIFPLAVDNWLTDGRPTGQRRSPTLMGAGDHKRVFTLWSDNRQQIVSGIKLASPLPEDAQRQQ